MASSNSNTQSEQHQNQHSNTTSHTSGSTVTSSGTETNGGSNTHSNTISNGGSNTQSQTSSNGGNNSLGGSRSVSAATGKVDAATLAGYDRAKQPYVQSQQVTDAYNKLQEALNNKPGAFSSKYESNLSNLYDTIMNRKDFSYNMNNDAMYQIYKDNYLNQGKTAMQDTVAASSALTGGYGNSYATTAGSQAYQNYLTQLNNIVPQLQQNAYNMYQDETSNLYNKANLTQNLYNQEYGQYRDTVNDWRSDRDYATNWYNNERNFDYSKYANDRSFFSNEYWNQRNAERTSDAVNWNNSTNWQNSNTNSNTTNWQNSSTDSNTTNWQNSKTFSIAQNNQDTTSETNSTADTNTISSTVANSYSGGGSSGGSGGSSRSSSKSSDANMARSGVTLDKGQRDTLTIEGIQAMQNGQSLDSFLKEQVDSGRITEGDRAYMLGNESYKSKSDQAYVKAYRG